MIEAAERAIERETLVTTADMKKGLSGLATIGTTAPFIGLFGTVIGIINAFRGMALTGSGGIAAVSTGIAEALVTTALGLFVAIPAVWMFNIFMNKIERFQVEMSNSSNELIDYFIKRRGARRAAERVARPTVLGGDFHGNGRRRRPRQATERHQRHSAGGRLPRASRSSSWSSRRSSRRASASRFPRPTTRTRSRRASKQKLISVGYATPPALLHGAASSPMAKAELQNDARRALPAQPRDRARHQGGPAPEVRRRQGSHSR